MVVDEKKEYTLSSFRSKKGVCYKGQRSQSTHTLAPDSGLKEEKRKKGIF